MISALRNRKNKRTGFFFDHLHILQSHGNTIVACTKLAHVKTVKPIDFSRLISLEDAAQSRKD
jgi:hypothetical protein